MKKAYIVPVILLGLVLWHDEGWAQNAYVTDVFEITLRTGPSTENKIITLLHSGQPLEVQETQEGWSRVKVLGRGQSNTEGWVLSRYLITRQPWEMQAKSFREESERLQEKVDRLEKEWNQAARNKDDLAGRLKEKSGTLQDVTRKYETLKQEASGYLELKAAYEKTTNELAVIDQTVQRLSKENDRLRSSQRNRWFATGALVLLCGLLIGLAVGRQQRKRKSFLYE